MITEIQMSTMPQFGSLILKRFYFNLYSSAGFAAGFASGFASRFEMKWKESDPCWVSLLIIINRLILGGAGWTKMIKRCKASMECLYMVGYAWICLDMLGFALLYFPLLLLYFTLLECLYMIIVWRIDNVCTSCKSLKTHSLLDNNDSPRTAAQPLWRVYTL